MYLLLVEYSSCLFLHSVVCITYLRLCASTEAPDWEVDHNGKIVKLPRPVHGLRVWNAQQASYDDISPIMAGK